MPEAVEDTPQEKEPQDPAERLLLHLLHHPYDLVDTRRLMRQFHASAVDFQRALVQFERYASTPAENPAW